MEWCFEINLFKSVFLRKRPATLLNNAYDLVGFVTGAWILGCIYFSTLFLRWEKFDPLIREEIKSESRRRHEEHSQVDKWNWIFWSPRLIFFGLYRGKASVPYLLFRSESLVFAVEAFKELHYMISSLFLLLSYKSLPCLSTAEVHVHFAPGN